MRGATESIVHGLGLPFQSFKLDVLQDSPTEEKLAEKFALWLAGQSGSLDAPRWLCLDSLDRPQAQPVRTLLLPRLLIQAAKGNLGQIQLVLLGYNAESIREVRSSVLHESARPLDRVDFRDFFDAFAKSRGVSLAAADLDQMTAEVLQDRVPPFDHTAMEAIWDHIPQVLREVLP